MNLRKIQANGHSLCVNLVPAHCHSLGLKSGDYVELSLSVQRRILVTPHQPKSKDK